MQIDMDVLVLILKQTNKLIERLPENVKVDYTADDEKLVKALVKFIEQGYSEDIEKIRRSLGGKSKKADLMEANIYYITNSYLKLMLHCKNMIGSDEKS